MSKVTTARIIAVAIAWVVAMAVIWAAASIIASAALLEWTNALSIARTRGVLAGLGLFLPIWLWALTKGKDS